MLPLFTEAFPKGGANRSSVSQWWKNPFAWPRFCQEQICGSPRLPLTFIDLLLCTSVCLFLRGFLFSRCKLDKSLSDLFGCDLCPLKTHMLEAWSPGGRVYEVGPSIRPWCTILRRNLCPAQSKEVLMETGCFKGGPPHACGLFKMTISLLQL